MTATIMWVIIQLIIGFVLIVVGLVLPPTALSRFSPTKEVILVWAMGVALMVIGIYFIASGVSDFVSIIR